MTKIARSQFPITYITRPNSTITTMKYPTTVKTHAAGVERRKYYFEERHATANPTGPLWNGEFDYFVISSIKNQ